MAPRLTTSSAGMVMTRCQSWTAAIRTHHWLDSFTVHLNSPNGRHLHDQCRHIPIILLFTINTYGISPIQWIFGSVLWVLMPWCFSTRASEPTVLSICTQAFPVVYWLKTNPPLRLASPILVTPGGRLDPTEACYREIDVLTCVDLCIGCQAPAAVSGADIPVGGSLVSAHFSPTLYTQQ